MNPVLKSTKPVIKKSEFVKINKEKLKEFCRQFRPKEFQFWLDKLPFDFPKFRLKDELNFLFVLNSLQFCFWGDPKWTVEYKGKFYDGSLGLLACLIRAIENGFEILNWKYLAKIPEKDLKKIFAGNVEIPLFKERLRILRENSKILIEKFGGEIKNLIEKGERDALKLLDVIVNNFPSFNDFAIYKGNKVFFYKKAQLFISEISRRNLVKLKNIDKLTALADYKIPHVLRMLKILEYSTDLAEKIERKIEIPAKSEEEIEIRANTIWAVELMKREIKKKIPDIMSFDIDSHLWLLSQKKSPEDKSYHLTRTIFY